MTILGRGLFSALILTVMVACDVDNKNQINSNTEMSASQTHENDDIQWFDGTVEEAFALAKRENKPLYFYWGAVWCPPCQEIKYTIFKHPKFIAQSRLFVPVYLDGDTERAQSVGERFAVRGYPTMIVFNSDGEELTRIPGGIDTRRYLDVLSLSLNQSRDMEALIGFAQASPQKLSASELIQLAYYSWWQGNIALTDDQTLALLKSLAYLNLEQQDLEQRDVEQQDHENKIALSRLLLSYLAMQSDLDRNELTPEQKQNVAGRLRVLLADPEQVLANMDFLSFYPAEIIGLLDLEQTESDKLVLQWVNSIDPETRNPLLSKAEHLGKWLAPVSFYWLQNPNAESLPEKLSTAIEAQILSVNRETQGEERQSVINRAGNLLRAAKMYPQATQLITEEIKISKSPYYFMSSLAEIAEETNDPAGIIEWRQKAYQAAAGKATRFQWGVEYLTALIQYQPENADLIGETAIGLFNDLDYDSDIYAGRNLGRLKTLLGKLNQWESERSGKTVQAFYARLQAACQQTDGESPQFQQCTQLLKVKTE